MFVTLIELETKNNSQYLNLYKFFFKHFVKLVAYLHLPHANAKIRLVKLVRDVPAERSELASLLHQGMEEAETEEQLVPVSELRWNKQQ